MHTVYVYDNGNGQMPMILNYERMNCSTASNKNIVIILSYDSMVTISTYIYTFVKTTIPQFMIMLYIYSYTHIKFVLMASNLCKI